MEKETCGTPTESGKNCKRPTDGGPCWQHGTCNSPKKSPTKRSPAKSPVRKSPTKKSPVKIISNSPSKARVGAYGVYDDFIDNILINADFKTIQSFCTANKHFSGTICSDSSFWKRIFARDGLVIIMPRTTLSGWINEYKKVDDSYKRAKRVVIKHGVTYDPSIQITYGKLAEIFPKNKEFSKRKPHRKEFFELSEVDHEIFMVFDDFEVALSGSQWETALIKLLYFHPKLKFVPIDD